MIGLKTVFGDFGPIWIAGTRAALLQLKAIVIYRLGAWQAHKTQERLSDNKAKAMPTGNFWLLDGLMPLPSSAQVAPPGGLTRWDLGAMAAPDLPIRQLLPWIATGITLPGSRRFAARRTWNDVSCSADGIRA